MAGLWCTADHSEVGRRAQSTVEYTASEDSSRDKVHGMDHKDVRRTSDSSCDYTCSHKVDCTVDTGWYTAQCTGVHRREFYRSQPRTPCVGDQRDNVHTSQDIGVHNPG